MRPSLTASEAASHSLASHLLVPCPDFPVKIERFLSVQEFPPVEEIGADHDSGASLPGLTVDGCHVIVVLAEPLVQVFAKRLDQLQLRGVVVFKGILCNWGKRQRKGTSDG